MKAMVLAAGLGTRLRPLTDDRPKALVEVAGRTLLEITLARLRAFGIREVIVNVHHFADMIARISESERQLRNADRSLARRDLARHRRRLEKSGVFFSRGVQRLEEPFILHNVDVISTIDLRRMVQFHIENQALATLAVQERETSRYLLFDEQIRLCGRRRRAMAKAELVRPSPQLQELAFCGIHVISPRLLR